MLSFYFVLFLILSSGSRKRHCGSILRTTIFSTLLEKESKIKAAVGQRDSNLVAAVRLSVAHEL